MCDIQACASHHRNAERVRHGSNGGCGTFVVHQHAGSVVCQKEICSRVLTVVHLLCFGRLALQRPFGVLACYRLPSPDSFEHARLNGIRRTVSEYEQWPESKSRASLRILRASAGLFPKSRRAIAACCTTPTPARAIPRQAKLEEQWAESGEATKIWAKNHEATGQHHLGPRLQTWHSDCLWQPPRLQTDYVARTEVCASRCRCSAALAA